MRSSVLLTAVPFPGTGFYVTDTTAKKVILSLPKVLYLLLIGKSARTERERLTSSTHISLWVHSSHFRLIGRGVPGCYGISGL